MTDFKDRASEARTALENVILDTLAVHQTGLYNNELARLLGLESSYEGRQKNYLTYSLLGGLLEAGEVLKEKREGRTYYMRRPS